MPRPATPPITWATDVNHPASASAWGGQPNKSAPSAGKQATGQTPGQPFSTEEYNYHLNLMWQWHAYLAEITSGADLTIAGDYLYGPQPTRTVYIDAADCYSDHEVGGTSQWRYAASQHTSRINSARIRFPLRRAVPSGGTIVSIEALVDPGAARAGVARMSLLVARSGAAGFPGSYVQTTLAEEYDNAGAAAQRIALLGSYGTLDDEPLDHSLYSYAVVVKAGDDGGAHVTDVFNGLMVQYLDPGPRSY